VEKQKNLFISNFNMKKFVKQIAAFLLITAIPTIIIIAILYYREPKTSFDKDEIYFWGDSQTVQGIDLNIFSQIQNTAVKTTATHGAGVYDFLVFANNVPDSMNCIVSFSQCCLLRKKSSDNNRSGIDIKMLAELWKHNYSLNELIEIVKNNRHESVKKSFARSHNQYDYCDTIIYAEPLRGFIKMYAKEPSFFMDKVELYKVGLDILMNKHCNLTFVEFPYYSELFAVSSASPYKNVIDSVRQNICDKYANGIIDTIHINDSDSLLMHDLTHLNGVGSRRTTEALRNYLDTCDVKRNHFIIVNGGSCN